MANKYKQDPHFFQEEFGRNSCKVTTIGDDVTTTTSVAASKRLVALNDLSYPNMSSQASPLLRYRQGGCILSTRGLATPSEPYDAVIIGGGM